MRSTKRGFADRASTNDFRGGPCPWRSSSSLASQIPGPHSWAKLLSSMCFYLLGFWAPVVLVLLLVLPLVLLTLLTQDPWLYYSWYPYLAWKMRDVPRCPRRCNMHVDQPRRQGVVCATRGLGHGIPTTRRSLVLASFAVTVDPKFFVPGTAMNYSLQPTRWHQAVADSPRNYV